MMEHDLTPAAPAPSPCTPDSFRKAMAQFPTGVTVLTARSDSVIHGMTLNAFASASLDPLLMLVSIHRNAKILDLLLQDRRFALSMLAADQEGIARKFARMAGAPQADVVFRPGMGRGAPIIEGSLAAMRGQVETTFSTGDHLVVVGKVEEIYGGAFVGEPLVFYGGRFRRLHHAVPTTLPDRTGHNTLYLEGLRIHYGEW